MLLVVGGEEAVGMTAPVDSNLLPVLEVKRVFGTSRRVGAGATDVAAREATHSGDRPVGQDLLWVLAQFFGILWHQKFPSAT